MNSLRLFALGLCALTFNSALFAATRALTISAPASVAAGQSFSVPSTASTDFGGGEQVGFFHEEYSINGGASWTGVCYDANVGPSAIRTAAITAGAAGTTIVIRVRIAFRGGAAGDVDYNGSAIDWSASGSWNSWQTPPTKYSYISVVNANAVRLNAIAAKSVGQTLLLTGSGLDQDYYRTTNSDLNNAFGATWVHYWNHFQEWGFLEGRAPYGGSANEGAAYAQSGLPVTFSVDSGPASISGSTLTFNGSGVVILRATQAGGTTAINGATFLASSTTTSISVNVTNKAPRVAIAASPASIEFGQSAKITSHATDEDGNLGFHGILVLNETGSNWYRAAGADHSTGWGNHPTTNDFTEISYTSGTASGASNIRTATHRPSYAGSFTYHANTHDGIIWCSNDSAAWAASIGYAYVTVNKATPTGTFPAKSYVGAHVVTAADLNASFANPYSAAVPAPAGAISYSIVAAVGAGASPTSGALSAGMTLQPGIYTIRATYNGDSNYLSRTVDTTITVSAAVAAEPDTDGDGMPDWWEDAYTLNKNVNDANLDANGNGIVNLDEYKLSRNPKIVQSALERLIADRLRGTVSRVELQIMTNGPGTVAITRDGQAATYVFNQAQGVWASYSYAAPGSQGGGAFFDLKDDVDVPVTVTGSSSTGNPAFNYTLYARPDPLTTRIATRSVVLNDHFVDAITKAELDAVSGALNVRVQVAGALAFGAVDMSRMDTMRTIQFGLGSDRAGRSVGSLTFNLGSYAEPTQLSSFDFNPGPGAIQVWVPRPTRAQVQGPAGYADMEIFRDRYIVKYYANGSYPLQSGLLNFGATTPLATYQFDLGAIPVDASNPYVPSGATLDTAYSALGVRLTRTLGSDVKLFEFATAWRTARTPQLGGPQVSVYTGYALTIQHQWPARNPGAPRGNLTVLSYQAAREVTFASATASTTYTRWRPILTKLSLNGDTASSEVGGYERLNYNTGDEKMNQAPSARTAGLGGDSHFEGGRPAVYDSDGVSLKGHNELNPSGGSTYTELFWDATPGFRPNNLGTQSRLALGLPKQTRKSFLDGAYADSTALVTDFTYWPDPIDGKTLRKTAVTKQNNVTVGQIEFAYASSTFDGKEILVTTKTDHPSAGVSLVTTSRTYSARLADTDYRDQPVSTVRPDGTKTSYAYQRGTLSGSAWAPGAGNTGPHLLIAQLDGKTGSSVSSYSGASIDALTLDPNKSSVTERILDASGRVLREVTYVYTGSTNFSPLSAVYYQYDNLGNLTRKADTPTGNNRIFFEAGYTGFRKEWETDEQGITRTYQYDNYGRVDWMKRAGATYALNTIAETKTTYAYDELGRVKQETLSAVGEADQLATTYAYDTAGRQKGSTQPGGIATLINYDSPTQTTTTLPGGGTKIATIYFDGRGKTVSGTAVADSTTTYAYDLTTGNLKTTQTTAGQTGSQTADWLSRVVSSDSATWGGGTRTVSNSYNSLGQLIKQETKSANVALVYPHLYQYDSYGRLEYEGFDSDSSNSLSPSADFGVKQYETSFTNTLSGYGTTWFLYTGQKVWPHGAANAGTFHYAAQSYTQVSGLTPSVAARSIAYDSDRNRTESTSAVNRTAKTLVTSTTTTGTTQTLAQITLNGLPISSTNAQGQTTLTVYDALGRLEATNDPRIGTSSVLYHANTAFVQFSIAPDNSMAGFTYDSAGRVAAQTNNNNKVAYFKYDAAGNLTHTWGDTTNPVWYEYNDLGQKTKMHTYRSGTWTGAALPSGFSLAGDVTTWNYQLATGLLDSKQDATSQSTYYQYDTMSRASKRTDARGWVTNYTYTLAGLPYTTDYTDAFTTDVTFNYDRAGRVNTVADASGSRTFGYYDTGTDPNPDLDLLNKSARVKSETLSAYFGSHVVNYGYQYAVASRANGALASVKIDTGSYYTVGYGYDTVGRLGTVSYNTATPFTYSYVPNANLVDTVAQSTTGYKRDYDYEANSNRRSSMKNLWGSLTASTVESRLTYDLLGQRNTEKTAGTAYMTALGRAAEVGVHADYLYTDRSELEYTAKYQLSAGWGVGSYRNNTDRDYTYDPIGNRTAEIVAGFLGSYTPNALNQYSSAPGAASLTYDLNGNLKTDGTRSYDYDGENRLIKVTQGASVWNYAYDYLGRRIRKWGTGLTEQRFIYDGWNLIAETDAVGNLTRRYAWGLDVSGSLQGAGGVGGLLLIQDGSSTYYPIYDASHNVIGLYNGSGGIDSAYEYDPFGKVQTSAGAYAAANPFRYSTKYTDNETSLTYYGHRYYSSTLGRFINRDPIEEAGGINLYGFCGNDGVNRFDYLGMDDDDAVQLEPFIVNTGERTAADDVADHQLDEAVRDVNSSRAEVSQTIRDYVPTYDTTSLDLMLKRATSIWQLDEEGNSIFEETDDFGYREYSDGKRNGRSGQIKYRVGHLTDRKGRKYEVWKLVPGQKILQRFERNGYGWRSNCHSDVLGLRNKYWVPLDTMGEILDAGILEPETNTNIQVGDIVVWVNTAGIPVHSASIAQVGGSLADSLWTGDNGGKIPPITDIVGGVTTEYEAPGSSETSSPARYRRNLNY